MTIVQTNVWIFYDIAHEAYGRMQQFDTAGIRPKPNGEPGNILSYDPQHSSFKEALTVIVFCGVYIEAMLHQLMVARGSKSLAQQNDRKNYKEKLRLVGCQNQSIFDACERYSATRREIMHEKAHVDTRQLKIAQTEAHHAIELVAKINENFELSRK